MFLDVNFSLKYKKKKKGHISSAMVILKQEEWVKGLNLTHSYIEQISPEVGKLCIPFHEPHPKAHDRAHRIC